MTIVEAKNDVCPNRVRMFTSNVLVESVAKQQWDLVKAICTQPFNSKLKYGISFITLHTEGAESEHESPVKVKAENSLTDKKKNFGKFTIRASDSESDNDSQKKKESPFARWKSGKTEDKSSAIKEAVKAKMDEGRKRIRMMTDSSEEEAPPAKPKPNRNRTAGLLYIDDDDAPNERLQKKIDKDKESREKEQKTARPSLKREKTPPKSDSKKSKFSSFIDDSAPSTSSSSRTKSPHKSSRSSSSHSSSRDKKTSPHKDKKSTPARTRNVTYKPFDKLLQGVVLAFSGYVNPERGILRQKALDMGAKYRSDWDSSCTHLICAFSSTPKYQQVKGKGIIVTKNWIEACFSDQKRLSWRRFALDTKERDEPESEEEIHNILSKPKPATVVTDSDDDMVVVDKRVKNGEVTKPATKEEDPIAVLGKSPEKTSQKTPTKTPSQKTPTKTSPVDPMDVSTDDDLMVEDNNCENNIFEGFSFFLNESDISVTTIIKLKDKISSMMGTITKKCLDADFVISEKGTGLPEIKHISKVISPRWVEECYELKAIIPRRRYQVLS